MSRHEMLQWVNTTLSAKYNKIEELCSGVAYCQLMEMLFPNCIGMKKVKVNAKLELDYTHNLRLLQGALGKLKFDKNVPIDKLVKGRFQDNFEFLQWFRKFYDVHSSEKENSKSMNSSLVNPSNPSNPTKPIRKAISTSNLKSTLSVAGSDKRTTPTSSSKPLRTKSSSTSHLSTRSANRGRLSPNSLHVLKYTSNQLKENIGSLEQERDYYFSKLQKIETLCIENEKVTEHAEWAKKVLTVLYDGGDGVGFATSV